MNIVPLHAEQNNTHGTSGHLSEALPAPLQWAARAEELAAWVWERLVNRVDLWGGYNPLDVRGKVYTRPDGTVGKVEKVTTRPWKRLRGHRQLQPSDIRNHFRLESLLPAPTPLFLGDNGELVWDFTEQLNKAPDYVLGLHTISVENTCKAGSIDIDWHDSSGSAPAVNLAAALGWYQKAIGLGFHPLLWDTNGHGGYRLELLFAAPQPAHIVYELMRWLVNDHADFGMAQAPETFPKQPRLHAGTPCGNWIRLVGRHHTSNFWASVWDGNRWREGNEAVDHILTLKGDDPALIPAEVIEAAEQRALRDAASERAVNRGTTPTGSAPFPGEPAGTQSRPSTPELDAYIRERVAAMPPSIEGQNGSQACIRVANLLVWGFDLPADDALRHLQEYNRRAEPAWSEEELLHKIESTQRRRDPRGRGYLLSEWFVEEELRELQGGTYTITLGDRSPTPAVAAEQTNPAVQEASLARLEARMAERLRKEEERRLRILAEETPERRAEREAREQAVREARERNVKAHRRAEEVIRRLWEAHPRRLAPCGSSLPHLFTCTNDPHKMFAGRLACDRLDCPHCRTRRLTKLIRRLCDTLLHETPAEGKPVAVNNPACPPRLTPLWVWEGDQKQWPALQKRMDRTARQSSTRPGYVAIPLPGDSLLVVADVALLDGEELQPDQALDRALARVELARGRRTAKRKQLASFSRAWRMEKKTEWKDEGQVPPPDDAWDGSAAHRADAAMARTREVLEDEGIGNITEWLAGEDERASIVHGLRWTLPAGWRVGKVRRLVNLLLDQAATDDLKRLKHGLRRGSVDEFPSGVTQEGCNGKSSTTSTASMALTDLEGGGTAPPRHPGEEFTLCL